ncbi:hypothetical protein ACFVAD_18155 [Sutcliffiella sp. NPDC057660]|uniref:hypothetical protein n=1 Tax=Sutcliffiella sp. NPDC057660 TaxID=3346199 RepID=UPI00368A796E
MYYESVSSVIYTLLFWWVIFLVFQRVTNRYPKSNTWKKSFVFTIEKSQLEKVKTVYFEGEPFDLEF